MNVSISPSFICNFRCPFCYLSVEQLADPTRLDLAVLEQRLREIPQIDYVDIYGGEVSVLPKPYLAELFFTIRKVTQAPINVTTNLYKLNPVLMQNEDISLSVSYDFSARERHVTVLNNLSRLTRPVSITMLASSDLIKLPVEYMIDVLNSLPMVRSVEIKPFSQSPYNGHGTTNAEFEAFVKAFISAHGRKFQVVNEQILEFCSEGAGHSFSDDHIYIMPSGKFAVLEFNDKDQEFFQELGSIDDYYAWSHSEVLRVAGNPVCGSCKYMGSCASEHLRRDVKPLDQESCNGFYHLIQWYDNRKERFE